MRYEIPINIADTLIEAERRAREIFGNPPTSAELREWWLSGEDNGPSSEAAQKLLDLFEEHNEFGGYIGTLHPNKTTSIDGDFPIETIVAEFISWLRQRGSR